MNNIRSNNPLHIQLHEAVKDAFAPYLKRVLEQNPPEQHAPLRAQFAEHMDFLANFCLRGYPGAGRLTVDFIKGLHRAMFPPNFKRSVTTREGTIVWMIPGEFKTVSDNVAESYLNPGKTNVFTAANAVPQAMARLTADLNRKLAENEDRSLKTEAILAFMDDFFQIHPFVDGNGRVAFALADLLAAREDIALFRFGRIKQYDDIALVRALETHRASGALDAIYHLLTEYGWPDNRCDMPVTNTSPDVATGSGAPGLWGRLSPPWQSCVEEAWAAYRAGCFPVGAVIADKRGNVLFRAHNQVFARAGNSLPPAGSSIAHAEINLLSKVDHSFPLHDTILYSTLEPCPMCASAIRIGGIDNIRYAVRDPLGGGTGLLKAGPGIPAFLGRTCSVIGSVDDELEAVLLALMLEWNDRHRAYPEMIIDTWRESCADGARLYGLIVAEGVLPKLAATGASAGEMLDTLHEKLSSAHVYAQGPAKTNTDNATIPSASNERELERMESAVRDVFMPYLEQVLANSSPQEAARIRHEFDEHMRFLADFCLRGYQGTGKLTVDFIKGLHRATFPPNFRQRRVAKDGEAIWVVPGEFKTKSYLVTPSTPREVAIFMAPEHVPAAMDEAVARLNAAHRDTESKDYVQSAILCFIFFDFLHIHPFADANGRIGLVLAELLAIRAGLPAFHFTAIKSANTTGLTRAVELARQSRDLAPVLQLLQKYGYPAGELK